MPRIRTVKPEFWDSPSTAKAGPWARLAFIGMWNWADDFGRGTLSFKELEGFIFPNDDTFTDRSGNTVDFRSVVAEVSECFGVVLYEVDGRHFYAIPSWDKHQRNERRASGSKHPDPPTNVDLTRGATEMHGISATTERKMQAVSGKCSLGTGEQGNRGTGEQGNSESASDDAAAFDEWWGHYPKKVDKGAARKAFKTALKKTDLTVLIAAADAYAKVADPKFTKNPATWLNAESWANQEADPRPVAGEGEAWMWG